MPHWWAGFVVSVFTGAAFVALTAEENDARFLHRQVLLRLDGHAGVHGLASMVMPGWAIHGDGKPEVVVLG